MAYVKRIVCLANSSKRPSGRCIAGVEILGSGGYGGWIRPVSARATAEISFSECRYSTGQFPKLLDMIDVPLLGAVPNGHQTENHLIEENARWVKAGELRWDELEQLRERPASIWMNSDHTFQGAFDCIGGAEAATLRNSLLLLRMKDFIVEVGESGWEGRTKRTYRGKFEYNGAFYNLSLTDPMARRAFSAKEAGDYRMEDVYICISLTDAFEGDGRCHKLVASIFKKPPL